MIYKKESEAGAPPRKERKSGKGGRGGKPLVIILLVLVLGVAAGAVFVLAGGMNLLLPDDGPAPVPFVAQGTTEALYVEGLPAGDISEESLREYYARAVAAARQGGYNTLLVDAKSGIEAIWRDKIFPADGRVSAGDGWFSKLDPLTLLMAEAENSGVQVWLAVDPYNALGWQDAGKGEAVSLAGKGGLAADAEFSPADADYNALLVESLGALPARYGVAGVVLAGQDARLTAHDEAWHTAAAATARSLRGEWVAKGYTTGLALWYRFGEEETSLAAATPLLADGIADFALVRFDIQEAVIDTVQAWTQAGPLVVQTGTGADTLALFTASAGGSFRGALLADLAPAVTDNRNVAALRAAYAPAKGAPFAGFDIPQNLSVNYPADGQRIYTEGLYIMGNSDPAQPLTLNGEPVEGRAAGGTFGVAVTLELGDNLFTFEQGGESQTITVVRPQPTGGSGGATQHDSTREAQPGQAVRITSQIASALTDPHNDGSMNETLPAGAVAVVQESVVTTRSGRYTYAYRLTSGDYVLAYNTEWVGGGSARFTGLSTVKETGGEWLVFEGDYTPAAYITYRDGLDSLRLTFWNTELALDEGFSSDLVTGIRVEQNEDGSVSLDLSLKPIWGYSLEYIDGTTRLYLKEPPTINSSSAQPLAGVHIVLDPGHGGDDLGAPGIMGERGEDGPNEKHVNLALAQTLAYRLRQLGAEVTMTREDNDSFPTLQDRLQIQTDLKPDLFISVHHNSAELDRDRSGARGSQAYYYHPYTVPASRQLAQNILTGVVGATGRSGESAAWGYFYVTRTTVCPSVLIEYGFMINPDDFEDITSLEGIYAAALGTAEGIVQTLEGAAG